MKTLTEKIAVMQAAERGEKIETIAAHTEKWEFVETRYIAWDWAHRDYRVIPKPIDIVVVAWNTMPSFPFVLNKTEYRARHDKGSLMLLSEQTITY